MTKKEIRIKDYTELANKLTGVVITLTALEHTNPLKHLEDLLDETRKAFDYLLWYYEQSDDEEEDM